MKSGMNLKSRFTDREHLAPLGLLLGNPPAQIDIHQLDLTLPASAPNFRKNLLHQEIPLLGKIPER